MMPFIAELDAAVFVPPRVLEAIRRAARGAWPSVRRVIEPTGRSRSVETNRRK